MFKFKNLCALSLAAAMFVSLSACGSPAAAPQQTNPPAAETPAPAPEPAAESLYTPGTYTAAGGGNNGDISVSVTFSADAITDISIGEHSETPGIADPVFERIPAAIVDNQSLAVDTISGATNTLVGVLAAIEDCITQAGGDVEALKNAPMASETSEAVEATADIIVVGGGGAGLSAALTAAEEGASVIIVEKTAAMGGNTITAGAGWNSVYPEMQDKIETRPGQLDALRGYLEMDPSECPEFEAELAVLKQQITEYLAGDTTYMFDSPELFMIQTYFDGKRQDRNGEWVTGKYELIKALAENSQVVRQWTIDRGVVYRDEMNQPIGGPWMRSLELKNPGGDQFFEVLVPELEKYDVTIMTETTATELITDNGKVVGVKAEKQDGAPVTLHAGKAVIMTTGGFGANTPMVQEYNVYWPDISSDIKTTNRAGATGDGIKMGMAIGANTVHLGLSQLMPTACPKDGSLYHGLVIKMDPQDFIAVNPEGKRFVNEMTSRDKFVSAALEQGGLFYLIADQAMIDNSRFTPEDIDTLVNDEDIYMADTLEELAAIIDVDPSVLTAEIERYNSFVASGTDEDFQKPEMWNTCQVGPFYASPRQPSIHFTCGGLDINENGQVLDTNGDVIEGLYAAGEVTGGIHAGNRTGGNAIASAFTFGRIAALNAVK